MYKRMATFVAILSAASVVVAAKSNPADYNGDGRISREEFRNQAANVAFNADKNKDGMIDDGEFKLTEAQRKAMDSNGDGKVSVEEFQEGQMAGFDEVDKNGDGFLDANEMKG
jgi:Ca2+-binding EF-hand superfamily protein